jgi:predicted phage terminase large subunit-like protein
VIEVNAGGDMAENTLRMVDPNVPVTRIHAKRGKLTRAEPVAALYEQGRISHVGMFPELEDEMCSFAPGLQGNGHDDRVDALVYSLSDLMVRRAAPLLVFG